MKTRTRKNGKEQFNTRIRAGLKRKTCVLAAALDWNIADITEVALDCLYGTQDERTEEKRKIIERTARSISLSFRQPDCLDGREELPLAA